VIIERSNPSSLKSDHLQAIGFKTKLLRKVQSFLAGQNFHHEGTNTMLMPFFLRPTESTSMITIHESPQQFHPIWRAQKKLASTFHFAHCSIGEASLPVWMEDMSKIKSSIFDAFYNFTYWQRCLTMSSFIPHCPQRPHATDDNCSLPL
jgi:hypothetical protein